MCAPICFRLRGTSCTSRSISFIGQVLPRTHLLGRNVAGTITATPWRLAERGWRDESYLAEPEDPESIDFDQRLIAARDNQAYLAAIAQFWKTELSTEDRLIVRLRWATDPPLSFQAIAQRLGDGWLVDTVRQRHRRILQRTLRSLIEQGLVNPDEPAR